MKQSKIFAKAHRLNLRKSRIRKKIQGTAEKPRLSVYRSLGHIYAQVIDDTQNRTLTGVSSLSEEITEQIKKMNKTNQAKEVGRLLAQKLIKQNIQNVVFDRNGLKYHGRVKALADASREAGLKF